MFMSCYYPTSFSFSSSYFFLADSYSFADINFSFLLMIVRRSYSIFSRSCFNLSQKQTNLQFISQIFLTTFIFSLTHFQASRCPQLSFQFAAATPRWFPAFQLLFQGDYSSHSKSFSNFSIPTRILKYFSLLSLLLLPLHATLWAFPCCALS